LRDRQADGRSSIWPLPRRPGHIHDFEWDEGKGTARDNESGKALSLPLEVPSPQPYDFLSARDQMVACAWLQNRKGGAIAYFEECVVEPDDMGASMQRWMIEQLVAGNRNTLGEVFQSAQRRYWLERLVSEEGVLNRAPRHYLCTANLYGDPSLHLRRVAAEAPARARSASAAAGRPPQVFQDFESGTYGQWKHTGTAFGRRPAAGALKGQNPVTGFGGKFLVNNFAGGDASKGMLTSPPFTIDRPYITFRIAGGRRPSVLCMNLLVGGKVVRSSTGNHDERLEWDF
jgi:hypothetical protein